MMKQELEGKMDAKMDAIQDQTVQNFGRK